MKHTAIATAIALIAGAQYAAAQSDGSQHRDTTTIHYSAQLNLQSATGDFAPYMIASWNHGKTTAKNAATIDLCAYKTIDLSRRIDWAAGIEAIAGYNHKATYQYYSSDTHQWDTHRVGPSSIWLQQLYATGKYRSLFLTIGMQNQYSPLTDNYLSSGDLVQSNNARPIPQVAVGFIDFQDIPFTKGWLQIEGTITYGKFTDNSYLRHQYNHYNSHLTTDEIYTYKRLYFRTNPSKPLSVTFGAQCAAHFGGTTSYYRDGQQFLQEKNASNLKAYWQMLIPGLDNGDGFVEGSSLGSWDLNIRYRLPDQSQISAYFQNLWEDGSSMAKRNKTDGLYGIRYHNPAANKWLKTALIEYIDMRDQSGPIHWAPGDRPGTSITTEATGADDYYNNHAFNAHAHYGMSIGSPFTTSPMYNRDGYPQFLHTRTNGMHAAAAGQIPYTPITWTAKFSYAQTRGNGREHVPAQLKSTSSMIRIQYDARRILPGLALTATAALDTGDLRGDNFGAQITITYQGALNL